MAWLSATELDRSLQLPARFASGDTTAMITEAEEWIKEITGRDFDDHTGTALTEYYSGTDDLGRYIFEDRTLLIPRHWPIASITSLHDDVDLAYGSDTEITAWSTTTAGYHLVRDARHRLYAIRLEGTHFEPGHLNIRLIYKCGFASADVPSSVKRAIVFHVGYNAMGDWSLWERQSAGGVSKDMRADPLGWIAQRFLGEWTHKVAV